MQVKNREIKIPSESLFKKTKTFSADRGFRKKCIYIVMNVREKGSGVANEYKNNCYEMNGLDHQYLRGSFPTRNATNDNRVIECFREILNYSKYNDASGSIEKKFRDSREYLRYNRCDAVARFREHVRPEDTDTCSSKVEETQEKGEGEDEDVHKIKKIRTEK